MILNFILKFCSRELIEIGCSNEIECLKSELLINQKLRELHSHYMICNTSNPSSEIYTCKEPLQPKAFRRVNLTASSSLITQPGSFNSAINPRANGAKRRSGRQPGARVLIPPGFLHPEKGKHSEV